MKRADIVKGQRFGKLTFIEFDPSNRANPYKCICDCGNIKYARASRLLDGTTSSCGCGLIHPRINYSGQQFGKLTVLSQYRHSRFRDYEWLCKCECGRQKWIRACSLVSGDTQSCGCSQYENIPHDRLLNEYKVIGEIVEVTLRPSNEIMVCDLDDWNKWKGYTWSLADTGYAYSKVIIANHELTLQFHNMVMPLQDDGKMVDHKNLNKLDNRRENLRYATRLMNNINKVKANKNNKCGYRGVHFVKTMNKWRAAIMLNHKAITIGYYNSPEEAYEARKEAEQIYFAPFLI